MKRITLFMMAVSLWIIFPLLAEAAPVGKFTFVEGRVDLIPPGQPARAVTLGDEVSVGDTLRTKSQSKAEVTFNDGNVLRLAEKTAMVISEYMFDQETMTGTLKLSRGKIQNIVKATTGRIFGRDKQNRFEVHTPTAVVGIRGTDFFTYYVRGITGAVFQEGTGYGFSVNKPEDVKPVTAGQAMVVVSADQIPLIKPATDVEIQQHINDTAPGATNKEEGSGGDTGQAALASATTGDTTPTPSSGTQQANPPGTSQTTSAGQTPTNVVNPPFSESIGSIIQQQTTPQGSTPVEFSGNVSFEGFGSGSLSGSLDPVTNEGTASITGILTSDPGLSHTAALSGTMSDGSTFVGDLGGAVGSWNVGLRTVYAKDGGAGYFYGDLSGSMNTDSMTFSASGTAYRSPAYGSISGTLSLVPDLLDSSRLPIISSLNMGTGEIAGDAYSSGNRGIETSSGRLLGIWSATTRDGYFENPVSLPSNTFVYGQHEPGSYYMLGNVSASDDLGSQVDHVTIFTYSAYPLRYMDTAYLGDISLWYHGSYFPMPSESGGVEGVYHSSGVGTYTLDPLKYTGYWGSDSLYSNNSGNFEQAGSDSGLVGGLKAPWDNPTSTFSAMGTYSLSETAPGGTYLWNSEITGWAPGDTETGFTGLTSGFWKAPTASYGTVNGAASAIYMTSDGKAGFLTSSDLFGYHFPGLSMWMADGTLVRREMLTVSNPSYYDIYDGEITGVLSGSFGTTSSILGEIDSGITRFFKDMHEGSPTYHTSLPWGIYNVKFGNANTFASKPSGLASWSATTGGEGLFGYISGEEDSGFWLAGITGTWSDVGELSGSLSGNYLTPNYTGTMAGPFSGINSTASSTWIGKSIGAFEGQPLAFSSDFRTGADDASIPTYRLVPGTRYQSNFGVWFESPTDWYQAAHYNYEYFQSQSSEILYGENDMHDEVDGTSWTVVYVPTGEYYGFMSDPPVRTNEGTWTIGDLATSDFTTLPDPPIPDGDSGYTSTGWEREWYEQTASNALKSSGSMTGILGGTDDLWTASEKKPATMTLMGKYVPSDTKPSLFGLEIEQSLHPSGGAYSGFLGGIFPQTEGLLSALYISNVTGSNNAGILLGDYSGTHYPPLEMWEANGSIYPVQKAAGISITPYDLAYYVDKGIFAAWVYGDYGYANSFLEGFGWGKTYSIRGYDGWGVFGLLMGYDNHFSNPSGSTDWTAKAAGWAEFGTHPVGEGWEYDMGRWLVSVSGAVDMSTSMNQADFSGKFLTLTKYGDMAGKTIGTYDSAALDWQAVAGGYWQNSQKLYFNGVLDGRIARLVAQQQGSWLDESGSYYYYSYYPDLNSGWSTYYDASSMSKTKTHVNYLSDGTLETWTDEDGSLSFSKGTWSGSLLEDYLISGGPGDVSPSAVFYNLDQRGWASSLMGGLDNLWSSSASSPARIRLLGEYDESWDANGAPPVFSLKIHSYNPYDGSVTIWNQTDNSQNGAYYGYVGGRGLSYHGLEGSILAVYLDKDGNAGFLKGAFQGNAYPGLDAWEAGGSLFPMEIVSGTGYNAADLYPYSKLFTILEQGPMDSHGKFTNSSGVEFPDTDIHWLSYEKERAYIWSDDQSWRLGVTSVLHGGTYSGTPSDYWGREYDYEDDSHSHRWIGFIGSTPEAPGSWTNGLISGKGHEAWVNWDAAVTGVSGTELKGTFDPVLQTWQTSSLWAWMDTTTFMNLAATDAGRTKLTALNIPCAEIGKTTLAQTNDPESPNYTVNSLRGVHMNDVTFFAYSTGGNPRIWATNDVGGNYIGTPSVTGSAVPLTGNHGVSADFAVKRWDGSGGNWGANVTGGGTYTGGGTMSGMTIDMKGAAAGKIDNTSIPSPSNPGSFSGTGSGVAKKQ